MNSKIFNNVVKLNIFFCHIVQNLAYKTFETCFWNKKIDKFLIFSNFAKCYCFKFETIFAFSFLTNYQFFEFLCIIQMHYLWNLFLDSRNKNIKQFFRRIFAYWFFHFEIIFKFCCNALVSKCTIKMYYSNALSICLIRVIIFKKKFLEIKLSKICEMIFHYLRTTKAKKKTFFDRDE